MRDESPSHRRRRPAVRSAARRLCGSALPLGGISAGGARYVIRGVQQQQQQQCERVHQNGEKPAGRNKRQTEQRDVSIHVVNLHIPRQ